MMTWKTLKDSLTKEQYKNLMGLRQSYRMADYDDNEEDAMVSLFGFVALLQAYLNVDADSAMKMAESLMW